MTRQFREDAQRFELRFCCEDCAYLDRRQDTCAHGWPDAEHRRSFYEDPDCPAVVFCKEFDLW